MTSEQVPIVVIGTGLIGKRHIQHILSEPRTRLSAIVEPGPNGPAAAQELGVPHFGSIEDLIAAHASGAIQVAGAIVGTPNATHVQLGMILLAAGIHCLVEKPLSTTVDDGRQLVAAAKGSNAKLLVGHHRRFNPHIRTLKSIIDRGDLGEILAISGVWTILKPHEYFDAPAEWRRDKHNGGPVLINLVHDFDLLRHLGGDIVRVYAANGKKIRGFDVEETGAITIHFASGSVGTFVFSDAVTSPYSFEAATGENPTIPRTGQNVYQIFGTKGSLSFPENARWSYPTTQSWLEPLVREAPAPVDDALPFTTQLAHFVDVIEGRAEPNCSGEEALKTMLALHAVHESISTGKPVDVLQE